MFRTVCDLVGEENVLSPGGFNETINSTQRNIICSEVWMENNSSLFCFAFFFFCLKLQKHFEITSLNQGKGEISSEHESSSDSTSVFPFGSWNRDCLRWGHRASCCQTVPIGCWRLDSWIHSWCKSGGSVQLMWGFTMRLRLSNGWRISVCVLIQLSHDYHEEMTRKNPPDWKWDEHKNKQRQRVICTTEQKNTWRYPSMWWWYIRQALHNLFCYHGHLFMATG